MCTKSNKNEYYTPCILFAIKKGAIKAREKESEGKKEKRVRSWKEIESCASKLTWYIIRAERERERERERESERERGISAIAMGHAGCWTADIFIDKRATCTQSGILV